MEVAAAAVGWQLDITVCIPPLSISSFLLLDFPGCKVLCQISIVTFRGVSCMLYNILWFNSLFLSPTI